ncbi:MAG: hypothetical protein IJU98_07185 [Synergistaceae bacterium]|nr:hypothetical protein [Synergistaceae bacterium]
MAKRTYTENATPTVIYAGPTMHRRMMIANSVYKNGLPESVNRMIEKVPDIEKLIVPVVSYPEVKQEVAKAGTEYNRLYNALLGVRFTEDGEVRE